MLDWREVTKRRVFFFPWEDCLDTVMIINKTLFYIVFVAYVAIVVQSLSHIWLFCDDIDCSLPVSSVHGISQARILEWVAISFSRGFSQPRDRTLSLVSPALQVDSLPFEPPRKSAFPTQEYWDRLPFPPTGNLPDPGIKAVSPSNPFLQ